MKYDVLIIGSGPAGMNAALYAKRSNLSVAIIEKGAPGGKLVNISKVDNFLGFGGIEGTDLAIKMYMQINSIGVESIYGSVQSVNEKENFVELEDGQKIEYKYLIIATGTSERVPTDIEGIEEFNHKGVSYCAICDGPLFKGAEVAVIGGGNSAIEEATFLTTVASKVHVFVRKEITAEPKLVEELRSRGNVEIHLGHKITKILGDKRVAGVETTHGNLEVEAIFPYIGLIPNTKFLSSTSIETNNNFIVVDKSFRTSVKNIYAIGDVVDKHIRQLSTAIADGTIAAKNIINLI